MDKKFENELKAVSKRIMILAKSVEKMIVMVGKLEKPKATKKPKAKVVKKKPVKKTVTKKVAAKKSATKKPTKTAVGTILGVIKGSKKGVDTAALMKKTGFNAKKVQNIVFKLKKQGKIKSEVKGIYLSA